MKKHGLEMKEPSRLLKEKINKLKEFYIDPTRKLKKKGFFYTNNMNQK